MLPVLHPGQLIPKASKSRFNVLVCGRRWGKTLFTNLDLVADMAIDGHPCGWFAPTYKFLDAPFRELRRALSPIIKSSDAGKRQIELITGGTIDYWTLEDVDAGRSRFYKRVVIDEAGLVKDLKTRWTESIRPTLADLEGDAWFVGTPKGANYFAELYLLGQNPGEPEWSSWQMPTSTNPYIRALEIEAARRELPDRAFRQEYLAEFIDDAGGVFLGVQAVIDKGRITNDGECAAIGVDLARVEDFTVVCGISRDGVQVYSDRWNRISWERTVERICAVAEKFPKAEMYLDSTGVGDPIYEAIRRKGVRVKGYQFTNQSKEALIDNLAMQIEGGRLRLMDIPQQTLELAAYQYEITSARNIRMNAPAGMHDDMVIALALAAWPLRQHKRTVSIISA